MEILSAHKSKERQSPLDIQCEVHLNGWILNWPTVFLLVDPFTGSCETLVINRKGTGAGCKYRDYSNERAVWRRRAWLHVKWMGLWRCLQGGMVEHETHILQTQGQEEWQRGRTQYCHWREASIRESGQQTLPESLSSVWGPSWPRRPAHTR